MCRNLTDSIIVGGRSTCFIKKVGPSLAEALPLAEIVQRLRTSPFQGDDTGSNPVFRSISFSGCSSEAEHDVANVEVEISKFSSRSMIFDSLVP